MATQVRAEDMAGVKLWTTPPSVYSGSATSLTDFKIQAGSSVITGDASGNATITYPTAFPNGLVGIWITNGDGAAIQNQYTDARSVGLSTFVAHISSASTTWRCNWIAVGF